MIGLGKGGRKFTNDNMDRQEEQYPWEQCSRDGEGKANLHPPAGTQDKKNVSRNKLILIGSHFKSSRL